MTIHLSPELEALIHKDVERGPYQSADEFVAHAVKLLHEQEQYLADNQMASAAKIDIGFASADRGDLLDPEEVRRRILDYKTTLKSESDRRRPRITPHWRQFSICRYLGIDRRR